MKLLYSYITYIFFFFLIVGEMVMSEELPDLSTVPADVETPPVSTGNPAPGKRVKQTIPEYHGTEVYYTLYLPSNWEQGKQFPVIVEYAGNKYTSKYGDVSPGTVEGSNLGYGISGGKDYIWVCMPFVNTLDKKNQLFWWGDVNATVDYCKKAVKQVCEEYCGDPSAVILTGFSRGAIACNYIGLHDDEIASIWLAFIAYSHYDGVLEWNYPEGDRTSAIKRLKRLKGRPTFICQETTVEAIQKYLEKTGVSSSFTFQVIPFRNHNDSWVLHDIPEREKLRNWLRKVIKNHTGEKQN